MKRIDILAAIVAILLVLGWNILTERTKSAAPASDWLVVNNVFIPSHVEGEDVVMTYDFTARQEIRGLWNVAIYNTHVDQQDVVGVCIGSGVGLYSPYKKAKPAVTLEWFMGRDCKLPPDEYVAVGTWTLQPVGYPDKTVVYTSNPFTVLPSGAQKYITPEQVQKLESSP